MAKKESSPLWMLTILLLVFAAVLFVGQWRSKAAIALPAPLPAVNVQGWMNTENPPTAADLAGKWVVVDLWATWCGPCIAAMPELVEFRRRWPEVVVIGIASDMAEYLPQISEVIERVPGFEWPVAYGGEAAFSALDVTAIPHLFLYNPAGEVAWSGHQVRELESVLDAARANRQPPGAAALE